MTNAQRNLKLESVNEEKYPIAVEKFNKELIKHPMIKKAAQFYKKTPAEIVKAVQQRLYTKGDRSGNTKEVWIDFKDTTSGITIKHKMKFNESVDEAKKPIGKKIFSDVKGKLFFGYQNDDDTVEFVDYKTWKKLPMKDLSNEFLANRVINSIVRNERQFNKKVEYNMWSKKTNPSFEDRMDYFIKNNWISNITKAGIKESVESVNEATLKTGTKLRYDKNGFIVDYVVDKKYTGKDGFDKYILKVVKSNFPKKIKVGSTEEYDDSKLTGLIRNRVMQFVKNESVNEYNVNKKFGSKYDIGAGFKGNGTTFWNRAEEENGDYKNIAHVSDSGEVKFYDKALPSNVKKHIEDYAKTQKESVNEAVPTQTKWAVAIASLTGTRPDTVQRFIDDNNLDSPKLYTYLKRGKLKERMDFVTALVGNPGNKIQKMIVSKFGIKESVTEGRAFINAARKAKEEGKTEFEFNGKKYPVTLKEGTLNEMNPQLNKAVKTLLDKELKGMRQGGGNHLFAVMNVLMGALTDANFHSESKKVPALFGSKAKYEGDPMGQRDMENLYQSIGERIATMAKWDGEDIAKAVGFYVSMTIGRPMGEKIEKLV